MSLLLWLALPVIVVAAWLRPWVVKALEGFLGMFPELGALLAIK